MKHWKTNLQPLGTPTSKDTTPTKSILSPSFSLNRNGSMPDIASYNTAIPAGVINLIPKSTRASTLKIFKVRQKQEKDLLLLGFEQAIKRGELPRESIKKDEAPLNIEFMIEKGKKEYEKKKVTKLAGSMYVNDLWGKQYEGRVKREARIGWEINNGEILKRKPLHLKLQEAAEFFEQQKKNSPRFRDDLMNSISQQKEKARLDLESDRHSKTDREGYVSKQFLLDENELQRYHSDQKTVTILPAINPIQKSHSDGIFMRDTAALSPKPSGFKERALAFGQLRKDGTTIYEPSGIKTDRIQLETEIGSSSNLSDCYSPRGGYGSKSKNKLLLEETKGALDNLINMCNKDVNEMKEIAGALNGVQKVFLKDVGGKKKRREEVEREHLMAKCADTLKKKRDRQSYVRLSM